MSAMNDQMVEISEFNDEEDSIIKQHTEWKTEQKEAFNNSFAATLQQLYSKF